MSKLSVEQLEEAIEFFYNISVIVPKSNEDNCRYRGETLSVDYVDDVDYTITLSGQDSGNSYVENISHFCRHSDDYIFYTLAEIKFPKK